MIEKAIYIQDYKIKVWFDDGNVRIIDLYPLMKKSTHPLTRKFLNKELFKQFRIETGTLCWGDNEFDINPFKVREGLYDAKEMRTKANELPLEKIPDCKAVKFKQNYIAFHLSDDRIISIPLHYSIKLHKATEKQRQDYEINGQFIFWDDIDEIIGVKNLLDGSIVPDKQ